ncbi:hypothetical protein P691DRAFT_369420 [Macrolepiota fuliginosa MF-IS2]|uniref:Uncharacterized protein n=1 Tax=Macrolepiota fuliginosa MF-IS2 TaxID=1400762 RepID=A0A9P5X399_9AGAR|nr:hypothetical protein P691DRAFT_369420 [Macrolepiota fuliginosa MF-IS2]
MNVSPSRIKIHNHIHISCSRLNDLRSVCLISVPSLGQHDLAGRWHHEHMSQFPPRLQTQRCMSLEPMNPKSIGLSSRKAEGFVMNYKHPRDQQTLACTKVWGSPRHTITDCFQSHNRLFRPFYENQGVFGMKKSLQNKAGMSGMSLDMNNARAGRYFC